MKPAKRLRRKELRRTRQSTLTEISTEMGTGRVDGQTAPYCLLLRPESPCGLGQRDLAIETASN
jgi:hypothetical protein